MRFFTKKNFLQNVLPLTTFGSSVAVAVGLPVKGELDLRAKEDKLRQAGKVPERVYKPCQTYTASFMPVTLYSAVDVRAKREVEPENTESTQKSFAMAK